MAGPRKTRPTIYRKRKPVRLSGKGQGRIQAPLQPSEITQTKTIELLREHWAGVIWKMLEVIGLGAALWALWASIDANELTRTSMKESRIINAWQILASKAPGNSGKVEALQALFQAGQELSGIDISCEAMDGGWHPNAYECDRRTLLAGLQMPGAVLNHANFSGVFLKKSNFSGAKLNEAEFSGSLLHEVNFSGAELQAARLFKTRASGVNLHATILVAANMLEAKFLNVNLSGAILWRASFKGANFIATDLSNAEVWGADFSNTWMRQVNLSGTIFCVVFENECAQNLIQSQINSAWAWADQPPIFQAGDAKLDLQPPPLCPISLREKYEKSRARGKPKGC